MSNLHAFGWLPRVWDVGEALVNEMKEDGNGEEEGKTKRENVSVLGLIWKKKFNMFL